MTWNRFRFIVQPLVMGGLVQLFTGLMPYAVLAGLYTFLLMVVILRKEKHAGTMAMMCTVMAGMGFALGVLNAAKLEYSGIPRSMYIMVYVLIGTGLAILLFKVAPFLGKKR